MKGKVVYIKKTHGITRKTWTSLLVMIGVLTLLKMLNLKETSSMMAFQRTSYAVVGLSQKEIMNNIVNCIMQFKKTQKYPGRIASHSGKKMSMYSQRLKDVQVP